MKKYLRFAPWIAGFFAVVLLVSSVAYEEHRASDKYKHHRTEWCAANFTTAQQKEACKEEKTDSQDYVPWEIIIISWPVGITAWAVLGTLFVIGWQSNETRRAAAATEKSVSIARRQIEMMKDRERARVEIKADSLALTLHDPNFWFFTGGLKLRNLGISRAYIKMFQAEIVWFEGASATPAPDFPDQGNLFQDSYIDPTEDWDKASPTQVLFFNTDSIYLDWFATAVYEGRVSILIRGVIEYRTVGTTYKRFFCWEWQGSGRPNSLTHMLGGSMPTTNGDKISSGFWKAQMDVEQEVENSQSPD